MKQYKILLSNVGYATGLNGSYKDYFLKFYRYIFRSKSITNTVLKKLKTLIKNEKPDVCCLIEVENTHLKTLAQDTNAHVEFSNKYGQKSFLRKLPLFQKKGNGILTTLDIPFQKHFFKHGTKKLIYEVQLNTDTSIFMAHFSLNKSTRTKQFQEINTLIKNKRNVIICGDFNIFDGLSELTPLLKDTDLHMVNKPNDKTFPSYRPKHILDIFITSKNIEINELKVLSVPFSDHLPVLLTCHL